MPAKADTSMSSVDFGKWKLVTSRSTIRKRYPGVMKISVSAAVAVSVTRGGLQRPHRGGADRDHRAAGGLSGGDLVNQRLRQLIPFTMHLVLGEIVDPHRLEGAGAYVQR